MPQPVLAPRPTPSPLIRLNPASHSAVSAAASVPDLEASCGPSAMREEPGVGHRGTRKSCLPTPAVYP